MTPMVRVLTLCSLSLPSSLFPLCSSPQLAQTSLFLYVALPVFSDWLIEEGFTMCYYDISEIGGFPTYLAMTLFYFTCVEIGIYWMHR